MNPLQIHYISALLAKGMPISMWTTLSRDCEGYDVLWLDGCVKMEVAG